jgi:release factor glutamine methyltransferase
MNANSQPQTQVTVKAWLYQASKQLLDAKITSARLDAEVILAHTTRKGRTYLHAHDDEVLNDRIIEIANARLDIRSDRVPLAYIVGHKEFYGHKFQVTTAVLVPRPESEDIINLLKETIPPTIYHLPSTKLRLIDIGTGSGCLGITAKLEYPKLDVTLADISQHALKVAQQNANQLNIDATILQSDLLANYPFTPDIILANLPYVNPDWERSPETNHEPALALFADNGGLSIIEKLIGQASVSQKPGGVLILEADPVQHDALIANAKKNGYKLTNQLGYAIAFSKTLDNTSAHAIKR